MWPNSAAADRQQQRIGVVRGRPEAPLGQHRRRRIVVDEDRQPEPLGHEVAEREVADRQVDRGHRDAALLVDQRGDSEADRFDLATARLARLPDGVDDPVEQLGGARRARRPVRPVMHVQARIDGAREELGAPEVHPDHAPGGHVGHHTAPCRSHPGTRRPTRSTARDRACSAAIASSDRPWTSCAGTAGHPARGGACAWAGGVV
jgi:hypothetical protein